MVIIKIEKCIRFTFLPIFTLLIVFILQGVPSAKATGILSITPATGSLINNCTATATISISIPSGESNAADIIIHYDTTKIEILDSIPAFPGIQIEQGTAFESYAGNVVDTIAGTIKLVGYSTSTTLSSTATFATIKFKPKPLVTSGGFTIEFTGEDPYNTLDSNIADVLTSFDMLQSVSNASYTFVSGSCTSDTTPPTITNTYPINGSTNIPSNTAVSINITDNSSGVDLSTIEIIINGESYVFGDPDVSISGSPNSYEINIVPRTTFPAKEASVITTRASDLSGNSRNKSIVINEPTISCPEAKTIYLSKECPTAPDTSPTSPESPLIIITEEPMLFSSGTTQIVFTVSDGTGIAPETFVLSLGGKVFSLATSPDMITFEGTKKRYVITVQVEGSELERTAEGDIIGYSRISDIDGNTKIINVIVKKPNGIEISKVENSNSFGEKVQKTVTIGRGSLLVIITFLSAFLSIRPTIATVYDGRTGRRIPFPRAYIKNKGRRMLRLSSIRGRIVGIVPYNGGTLTVQKYGYRNQDVILTGKEKQVNISLTKV